MSDIVSLDDYRPHLEGKARCVACGREWQAVAPVGTVELECPGCGTDKGLFVNFAEPANATQLYVCACGSYAFGIYVIDGVKYVNCLVCGKSTGLEVAE